MAEWKRARIGDLCDIVKGETGLASSTPGPYPLVATGADRRSCESWQFNTEAVCIPLVSSTGHGKKTLNYVHFQSGKFAVGTILAAVIPKDPTILTARFLHLYLSHFKDSVLVPLMKGAANVSLSMKEIASVQIPVPPLVEQQSLIDLIFHIEDEHRDLLKETNRQGELLKQLRHAVLQDAVEGKLTAEWREQHPMVKGDSLHDAAATLAQVKAEKERLGKGRKSRKENLLPFDADSDKLYDLPEGWVWVKFGEIAINRDDGRIPISQVERDRKDKIYPYYGASGVIDKIDGFTHEGENLLVGEDGANLVARSTPVAFIATGRYWVNNHAHVIGFVNKETLNYLEKFINAIDLMPYITGGFQPKLSQANLLNISVALPPLSEQQEIVACVDVIMATIDELEEQVAERKEQVQLLMQAVLREAFNES